VAITDAVIPVGGLGTRLLPATRSQPKEMLPVVDKPVVQYVVEELVRAGIARVLFVTGRRKRAIEDHYDADPELDVGPLIDPRTGLRLLYTRQAQPAGLGDAVRYAEGFAEDRGIVVALGDAMIETPAAAAPGIVPRLIEAFSAGDVAAAFAVAPVPDDSVSRYGVAVGPTSAHGAFVVERVVEKPDPKAVASRTAIMGRYVIGPAVFAALRETRADESGEVQLTTALQRVIASGARVIAVPLGPGERRHDVGSIESYCSVFLEYALGDPRIGPGLRARVAELIGGGQA
jgi:UTP--glucose-1-phosphate uridylyltransferase